MSAPLDGFVAGAYFGFYTPSYLGSGIDLPSYTYSSGESIAANTPLWVGSTKSGFTVQTTVVGEAVEGDIWGGSVVEMIYRGGNMFLFWEALAFRAGTLLPYWPWSTLGRMGTIGRLGSLVGGSMNLVAAPGTPASGTPSIGQVIINSLSALNCVPVENQANDINFDSRLRRLPIKLRMMPYYYSYTDPTPTTSGTLATVVSAITRSNQTVAKILPAVTPSISAVNYQTAAVAEYRWFEIL